MATHQVVVTIVVGVRARNKHTALDKVMCLLDDPIIDALQDDCILGFSTDLAVAKPISATPKETPA